MPQSLDRLFDLVEEVDELVDGSGLDHDDPLKIAMAKLYREKVRLQRVQLKASGK